MISACIDGAISDTVMVGHLQQNEDTLDLLKILTEASKLPHAFLTTSGAMAVENALKIAFQKKTPAHRILAFEHCFAGRTTTLAQVTDKAIMREGLPGTLPIDYIPFYDSKNPEKSTEDALLALKKCLLRYPAQYAAMVFELVQGEGGFNCATREFFVALMQVLKEAHVAVIVDEVQTFGRLPEMFAYQYYNLSEYVDICTIGKLSVVCATLFSDEYTPRAGLLSQTFTSSSVAIRAAKMTLETLLKGDFYGPNGQIVKIHEHFVSKLEGIAKRHPSLMKGPFGIGGMIAFTPYGGEVAWVTKMANSLFDAGLITFTAGSDPMRIRLLPPIGVLKIEDIDKACEIIEETLINLQTGS
jgi:4-aminobutyrate aminotransferase-like enzyme